MKLSHALAALALTFGLVAPAMASHGPPGGGWRSWDLIGTREVRHRAEYDRVFARGFREYKQIKLCAYQRGVRLYDLDIVFRNGGHQDVRVRHFLRPGECTRAIDLYGYRRDIRFVTMAYETAGPNFGPRAVVQVFAR